MSGWKKHGRLIVLGLVIVALIVAARLLPLGDWLEALDEWTRSLGFWGPFVFGAIYVAAALLFVPGSAITLAAGAIFGLGIGFVVVSIASTTAATLAFLIARTVGRDHLERLADRYPKFAAIDRAIAEGGWKIVGLLRLSPVIPFSIGNYLFGLTAVRTLPYVLASWIGMAPGTFLYVYLGHLGRSGLEVAASESPERTTGEWLLLGAGLVSTIVVTVIVTRLARRALDEQTDLTPESNS
ncbi:MAG: TVP38/TMEM64 family protein [Planctomycetota bacterium]